MPVEMLGQEPRHFLFESGKRLIWFVDFLKCELCLLLQTKSNFNHPSIIYAQSTKKLDPRYGFCVDVLSTATTAFDVPYAAPSSVWKPWTQAFFPSENPRLNGGFEKTSTPFKGLHQMMDSSEVETLPAPKTQKTLPTLRTWLPDAAIYIVNLNSSGDFWNGSPIS